MAIIYSYPSSTPLLSDLMIISRTPSNPNETANYSISLQDLAGLLSGTGTVTSFSATSTIPGITTTVSTATTTPSLTIGITGAPAAGTYLDNTGNFTTPAGGGGGIGTLQQVLQAGNVTGNNKIFAQGGASGGINIAEDTDLTFGPSNQLTMRYNSNITESEIVETGTGGLTIAGSTTITLKAGLSGETYAIFNDNGAVSLRYDDVVKFETTTNGIKVTDRIEASTTNANLQVQGNGTGFLEVRSADGATAGKIQINNAANSQSIGIQAPTLASSYVLTLPTTDGSATEVLSTDGNGVLSWVANAGGGSGITGSGVDGRVTFWTGTSTVSSDDTFLWDSTNNRLGVGGTTAPSHAIDVTGTNYYASNGTAFAYRAIGAGEAIRIGDVDGEGVQLALYDNNSNEIVRVVDGSVGIGTTTPGAYKLMVNGSVRITGAIADSSNATGTAGQLLSSTGSGGTSWVNNLSGSGTIGTISMFFPNSSTISDSIITQNTVTSSITIGGSLSVNTNFQVDGISTFNDAVTVDADLSVTGDLNMNAAKIFNLANPANAQDAATKAYVDSQSGSATNLGNTPSATDVEITSSSGTNTTIAAANAVNNTAGVITATDKAKLDIAIVGNTLSQTAPTIIQTVTQTEYNNLTPVASTIYIIV